MNGIEYGDSTTIEGLQICPCSVTMLIEYVVRVLLRASSALTQGIRIFLTSSSGTHDIHNCYCN